MFNRERQVAICDLLAKRQRLTSKELEQALGASSATVRRDLADLEAQGLVVRVHGGILHPDALRGEQAFAIRSQRASEVKRAMTEAALALAAASSTIYIDAGTTTLDLGRRLLARPGLTLVTNSIPLLSMAAGAQARVVCVGGTLKEVSMALVGELALEWLANLRCEIGFFGCSGLCAAEGASSTALDEAVIKQAALRRVATRVLMADSSKWNRPAAIRFAPWSEFHHFITDDALSDEDAAKLGAQGLTVTRVPV